jgi:5-methylcytosine-specific restriction enzyme B
MARWTGDPFIESVLKAAGAWRRRCVETDGSIFSSEPLWTLANLTDLKTKFLGNPIAGSDKDFYQKLNEQLSGATPSVIRLAAEVVWLLLLFPHHSKFGPEKKREQIREVWEWSKSRLPQSEYLSEDCLKGVGNPGTAYLTRRFEQFGFALEIFANWKQLTSAQRTALLSVDAVGRCSMEVR